MCRPKMNISRRKNCFVREVNYASKISDSNEFFIVGNLMFTAVFLVLKTPDGQWTIGHAFGRKYCAGASCISSSNSSTCIFERIFGHSQTKRKSIDGEVFHSYKSVKFPFNLICQCFLILQDSILPSILTSSTLQLSIFKGHEFGYRTKPKLN